MEQHENNQTTETPDVQTKPCQSSPRQEQKNQTDGKLISLLKQNCPKHNIKCNGFNGYNGNYIGFNINYNGVYWYGMDSLGGILNPIGKMPKVL